MKSPKIIAVDFDGTICEDEYPKIGEIDLRVLLMLKRAKYAGDKLILWTCRRGTLLKDAIDACAAYGLTFDAVNENLPEVIESFGGDTRKIYADEYWDDKSVRICAARH